MKEILGEEIEYDEPETDVSEEESSHRWLSKWHGTIMVLLGLITLASIVVVMYYGMWFTGFIVFVLWLILNFGVMRPKSRHWDSEGTFPCYPTKRGARAFLVAAVLSLLIVINMFFGWNLHLLTGFVFVDTYRGNVVRVDDTNWIMPAPFRGTTNRHWFSGSFPISTECSGDDCEKDFFFPRGTINGEPGEIEFKVIVTMNASFADLVRADPSLLTLDRASPIPYRSSSRTWEDPGDCLAVTLFETVHGSFASMEDLKTALEKTPAPGYSLKVKSIRFHPLSKTYAYTDE